MQLEEPVRVPLVGSSNIRYYYNADANAAASGIVGSGIVGTMVVGAVSSSVTKDQRFINAIPDRVIDPLTESIKFYVYKRPGFVEHSQPENGSVGSAIKIWTGQGSGAKVISAFGATNSTIYDGETSLGAITGKARDITETLVGTTPTIVIPSDDSSAWYYQEGGSLTEITDVDYPGNATLTTVGTFVHMDGYSFIMTDSGRIYNSDLNSISAWSSTSFLSAQMYPDQGIGLARYKDLIVAFGKETMEFFKNVGNATGSPLQRVPEAFTKIGALSANAITQLEDNIAWAASTDTGSVSIYMLDGYKPVRISDNSIDIRLTNRVITNIYLSAVKMLGKTFVFVVSGSNTFVYCVEDKMWHQWSGTTILWHRWAANTTSTTALYSISCTGTDGKVYVCNPVATTHSDDGTSFEFYVQTSKLDMKTERRKFIHRLTVVGDNTTNSTNLSISWSDDDYETWSTARTVDLSSDRKYLTNLGQCRRRAFRFTNTSTEPIRLEALEFELGKGMH